MEKIRALKNKFPWLFALLGIVTIIVAIQFLPSFTVGEMTMGVREVMAGVVVLLIYWFFAGPRDIKPNFTGVGYGFRISRYLFILYGIVAIIGLVTFIKSLTSPEGNGSFLTLANAVLICAFVGIVEEFTFRAMLFGGLVSTFGKTKQGVIWAAVVSAVLFGFIHVAGEVFGGQITDASGVITVIGKTLEAGAAGFLFCLVYFKTRNIWVPVLMHNAVDFSLFLGGTAGENHRSYVISGAEGDMATKIVTGIYLFFTVITIPAIIRSIRELNREEQPYVVPLDEEFKPRKVKYLSRRKLKQMENK